MCVFEREREKVCVYLCLRDMERKCMCVCFFERDREKVCVYVCLRFFCMGVKLGHSH